MFRDTKAVSSFSVNDLAKAKEFYGQILDLETKDTPEGLEVHLANNNRLFVYRKPDHTPASFTVLNFVVTDVDKYVDELTNKGVTFEQYDDPIKTDKKGIHRGHGPTIAWFKDPAGNILSVLSDPSAA